MNEPADYSLRSRQLNSNRRHFRGLVEFFLPKLRIGSSTHQLVDPVRSAIVREPCLIPNGCFGPWRSAACGRIEGDPSLDEGFMERVR